MDKSKILNDYLDWKQGKMLYPPQFTPEEFLEEILNKDARKKLDMIYEELQKDQEPMETLVGIQEIMEDNNDE